MSAVKQSENAAEKRTKSGFGFAKSARLLKHSEFEKVYQNGRRYSLPHFAAFYLKREAADPKLRVGFTVGRVLGGAVQRNRIRRRLREAVRLNLPAAVGVLSADIVLQPRKSALLADFRELQQQVAEAFRAVAQNRGAEAKRRSTEQKARK
jgi:ribonuclease P protein component